MSTPTSISDLIARWPTLAAFAIAIDCGYEAARKMRDRDRIAPEHWPAVVAASSAQGIPGITLEWLSKQRVAA